MISLSRSALTAIAAHAQACYPDECVGLLLGQLRGDDKLVSDVAPVENRWAGQIQLAETDNPASRRDRFYLDPRDYLRVDREASARGLDILGCYHSHPDAPAQPSERDRVGAQAVGGGTTFSFVIQALDAGQARQVTSWLLAANGGAFVQEALVIVDTME